MARRAMGVSANLRRFAGVGLGVAFWPARPWLKGLRMEGSMMVFLSPLPGSDAASMPVAMPAIRCHAFVAVVRRLTVLPLSDSGCVLQRERHSVFAVPFC